MDPFYTITEENPNENFGVRACIFAGQQKSHDCGGRWVTASFPAVRIATPFAPKASACESHLRAIVAALDDLKDGEAIRLGYGAPPTHKDLHENAGVDFIKGGATEVPSL
jgi:hypothetical protein